MKTRKIIYWVATAMVCFVFGFSIFIHLFKTEMVQTFYASLGFPTWLVVPSGIAKILALIAILSNQSKVLKEWAYAGLFIDAALALSAHLMAGDGAFATAAFALVALMVSRVFWN